MWPFILNCQNLKTSSRSPNLNYPISHFLNRILRMVRKRDPQSWTVAVNISQRRLTRNGEDIHPRIMSYKLKWGRERLTIGASITWYGSDIIRMNVNSRSNVNRIANHHQYRVWHKLMLPSS